MRVLHSVWSFLPLTETWIYGQIRHLSLDQAVICLARDNARQFPFDPVRSTLDAPVLKGGARLVELFTGRPWTRRMDRLLSAFYDHGWPLLHRQDLRRWSPRIVHAHFGDQATRTLGLKRALRVPMVSTFYGYDLALVREPFWKARYRELFDEGDLFLVEGRAMARTLASIGCPPEKIRVQHLGVDLSGLPYAPRQAPESGPVRLLISASFREKKGISYALDAIAKVWSRYPLALTVIGDGPLRESLHAQATQRGLPVEWLGYQPHSVVLEQMRRAHLFIQPSVTAADGDTEGGAPVSIIEAQATGLPILATTHADIPEVTIPERSALLAPERDADTLARLLAEYLDHPDRWPAMSAAGRAHVEAEYDAVRQGTRLESVYRSLA